MRYWIDRFPRLLSHSYHALQSCCNEPIFSGYYPQNYAFCKPEYFYEETEDFKPFDGGQKTRDNRDSPKRYNPEYRYKPMNYPNFVMDRKPASKLQNNGSTNMADIGNYRSGNHNNTKKGSYNFHRFWTNEQNHSNNFKVEQNDTLRYPEIFKPQNSDIVQNEANAEYRNAKQSEDFEVNENASEVVENQKIIDKVDSESDKTSLDDKPRQEKFEKATKRDENQKHNDRHISNKKKPKTEAVTNKGSTDVDEEGFTKVTKKNNSSKKQKNTSHQNENVNWIIPGKDIPLASVAKRRSPSYSSDLS